MEMSKTRGKATLRSEQNQQSPIIRICVVTLMRNWYKQKFYNPRMNAYGKANGSKSEQVDVLVGYIIDK